MYILVYYAHKLPRLPIHEYKRAKETIPKTVDHLP